MLVSELISRKCLTLHQAFEFQAEKTPESIAVVFEREQLTYGELNQRANQLAHYLRSLHVTPEMLVGIYLERSIEMVVGMLGILKAGAAFVPIDPSQPQKRLAFILADTKIEILVTLKRLVAGISEPVRELVCLDAEAKSISDQSKSNPVSGAQPANLAYTIYTSGSTGQPKGVMVSHKAICQGFLWMQEIFPITQQDRVLQKLPLTFDFSFWELFWPLMTGANVVLAKPGGEKDIAYLVKLIAQQEISVLVFVPSVLQVFLSANGLEKCWNIRMVFTGGEALNSTLKDRFFNQFPNCNLYDLFGATENIVVTYWHCQPEESLPGCSQGRLFPDLSIYVVDEQLQPVPAGESGELLVAGWGLARGYLNRPELTAQKFVSDPFKENSQEQFYRTGDLVRYLGNDTIEILGRVDHQVKIRGFRIELGEIEATLTQHPNVQQAVVIIREDMSGDKRLVAYCVTQQVAVASHELREFLQQCLPEYMIPNAFVKLDALPLTPNGKVDRCALPAPETVRAELKNLFVAPRTLIETALEKIWAEVLKLDQVGIYDEFLELGGHSLLAMQIISRITNILKVELSIATLFTASTIAELAKQIEVDRQKQSLLAPPIQSVAKDQPLPLSYAQERLWFLAQLEPSLPVYNEPFTIRFPGAVDINTLEKAINEMIRRHESLRTRFIAVEGQPFQIIDPPSPFCLRVVDLRQLPLEQLEPEALQIATLEAKQSFDLATDRLLRATLIQLADDDYRLFLTMHHIIMDGSHFTVFLPELATLYEAIAHHQPSPLTDLPVQYADFAIWQRQQLQGEALAHDLGYWKQQLGGELPTLQLPSDRPRLARRSFRGARQCLALSKSLTEALRTISKQEGATLYMVLLTAFKVLLYRYTGQDDVVIGTVSAGRSKPEIENVIGFFLNTLVLRTDLSGLPSFRQLLARVRDVTLQACDHEDLPFEQLVESLQLERNLNHNPLFEVMFVLEPPIPSLSCGWTLSQLDIQIDATKFDLTLELDERPEGIIGRFEYSTDLFDEATIARMIDHFQTLLESIVANPDQQISELPLLTEAERYQLLVEWNDTKVEYPQDKCIHQLFEEQVERTPDAIAVVFEDQQLTYRELNTRANQLAHYLKTLGVRPDVLAGICVERSLEMVIGILGILKAGGAYVPLDPAYPQERLAFMLEDAAVPVLLTQSQLAKGLPVHSAQTVYLDGDWKDVNQQNQENITQDVKAKNLAYVIYTSGSTGQPKGVCCNHVGVVNLLVDFQSRKPISIEDRCSLWTVITFDVSVYEIFSSLLAGGSLLISPDRSRLNTKAFFEWLSINQIHSAYIPPFMLKELAEWLNQPAAKLSLQRLLVGVEPIHEQLLVDIVEKVPELLIINGYGPTEATVCATLYSVNPQVESYRNTPIGKPVQNIQVYILDRHLQPVPIGAANELHIGGDGLARGYLHRSELTQEKFIPNPFSNESESRLYKTGDLARYLPDGNIEFLGRIDHQVKIRGFRIELGEIEAALSQHPAVQQAVVVVQENEPGDKRLVAYFAVRQAAITSRELRDFLKQRLPEYMIPAAFVRLDSLPLTLNGKVDRRALPAPEFHPELELSFVVPRTPVEELLASIWSTVLNIEQIGIGDNFFELGGHSLLATQVISRVNDTWSIELPLRSVFEAPTIAEFARHIEKAIKREQSKQSLPLLPISRSTHIPLSFAQQRLWFLDRLHSDSAFYNVPIVLRLNGQLSIAALETSLNEIVHRHEVLRTNFITVEGQPVQVISPILDLSLQQIDLWHLAKDEQDAEAQRLVSQIAQQPFDLEREPLFRIALIKLSETEYIFVFLVHHIVFDAWSVSVFIRELETFYTACCAGKLQSLSELPIQYSDFASWQRQWLQGVVKESQLSYWKKQLENSPVLLQLPTDRPRPATQTFRGASQSFVLSQEFSEILASLSRRWGTTLFMTLVAAFQVLLYRYTGQDDVCTGTPIANRNHSQIEQLIGFFTNTLVLRTDLSGNPSFEQLLNRVREVALDAYAHQDLPFEELVEALQPTRSLSHAPLFQVMFVLQNASSWHLLDLTVHELSVDTKTAKFDLTLSMEKTSHGLTGVWEYNSDLFDAETIARMIGHFQTLLESIVANPNQQIDELPLLSEAERHQLLVAWNNTKIEYPQDKCIHQLFEEQVERTPDAVAVVFEDQQLTYQELNEKANQLAHHLQQLGVKPEVLVGICVERSLEMFIGILGILKAGGAYVPLDPTYPQERLALMLEDAATAVLLTQQHLMKLLPSRQTTIVCLDSDWQAITQNNRENPDDSATPDNLVYVIYTSGSTGRPKGVAMSHRSLSNLIRWQITESTLPQGAKTLQFSPLSFDVSFQEIFSTWCAGGTLVLISEDIRHDPLQLLRLLHEKGISRLFLPFVALQQLAEISNSQPFALSSLREVITAGEQLHITKQIANWLTQLSNCTLYNHYGPSENHAATSLTLTGSCSNWDTLPPIGRPISNIQIYILNAQLQPVPVGVSGELHIGGDGLARGYLNRPDLTQEKFIPNPFGNEPDSRLYKTGDLARYLPDGNIEFLGRIDHQVKIRGFRIELGEIEAALTQHPDVREAVVTVREDVPDDKRLVAYITSNLIPDRIPYQSECLLELDGNTLKLRTEDISNSGIGLVDAPAMAEHTSVRLHLLLPETDEAQWFIGTVAWSRSSAAGIQLHLTPPEQALLDQSITYLLEIQGLWKTWQRTIAQSLRQHLKNKLPDYMIPSAFVLLQTLPLTPNGKIDRRALPSPDRAHQQEAHFVAPRTPTEISLAAIWAQVLGLQQVGIHDNFFELGGHSLLAVQIISRIRAAFAIDLPLSCLFESPTIAALSQAIIAAQENYSLDQRKTPLAIVPVPRDEAIPLSFSQHNMWYAEQHYAGECAGNLPLALRLTGSISPAVLEQSLNEIIRRHEVLRTAFPTVEGEPIQKIYPDLTVPLQVIDLQNLPLADRELKAQRILSEVMSHRFDLSTAPLIKTVLIQLSAEEHWFLILMHHIIIDGWSYGVLFEELETLYSAFLEGKPSPLPKLPFQYADFAIWQRNYFSEEVLATHLPYWEQHLANLPTSLDLLPATQSLKEDYPTTERQVFLPQNLTTAIESCSHTHSVTPFVIFLTALNILLSKWSNQTDILVASTLANRITPELEKLLGCFISDLPMRFQVDYNQSATSLMKQIKQMVSETLTHQIPPEEIWKPFEEKIEVLRTVNLVLVPSVQWSSQTLKCDFLSIPSNHGLWSEQCTPLELYVSYPKNTTQAIEIFASYSTTTFTLDTIDRFISSYQAVLQKLTESPETQLSRFQLSL